MGAMNGTRTKCYVNVVFCGCLRALLLLHLHQQHSNHWSTRIIHYHIYWSHTAYVRDDCDGGSPKCIVIKRCITLSVCDNQNARVLANILLMLVLLLLLLNEEKNALLLSLRLRVILHCRHTTNQIGQQRICNVSSSMHASIEPLYMRISLPFFFITILRAIKRKNRRQPSTNQCTTCMPNDSKRKENKKNDMDKK